MYIYIGTSVNASDIDESFSRTRHGLQRSCVPRSPRVAASSVPIILIPHHSMFQHTRVRSHFFLNDKQEDERKRVIRVTCKKESLSICESYN